MSTLRLRLRTALFALLVAACGQPAPDSEPAATAGEKASAEVPVVGDGAPIATVSAVLGAGGVRTPGLPDGAFLGQGARLGGNAALEVPAGTMVEIKLDGGATLRVNERTRLRLPAEGSHSVALDDGELLAIVPPGQPPLELVVAVDGDATQTERLEVITGEARSVSRIDARAHDVVYGHARLHAAGRTVELGPGSHVDTKHPVIADGPPAPELSVAPLEQTEWSRSFEMASQMLDEVPAGIGSLTTRAAGSSVETQHLALVDQKVHVSISGRIAHTEIEQTFYNDAPRVLEGTYRFPLPADASISGLSLLVGNKWMDAAMVEKSRAQRIFKSIVDATIPRDPALLHWERGNIFKLKIFPIPGRGERKIRLSYTQVLPTSGEALRYRYPIAGSSSGATGSSIENFEFKITVDRDGLPPGAEEALATPMLPLDRSVTADRIELTAQRAHFRPAHDLGVDIPLAPDEARVHTETHLDRDNQAYFMVGLRPALKATTEAQWRPADYVFVLDRSHSTTPELWTVARSLVKAMGEYLGDGDRVQVLACDSACDQAPGGLMPASGASMEQIDRFLGEQMLAGASDLEGSLREAAGALKLARDGLDSAVRDRVLVYLGDGTPTAGELRTDKLLERMKEPLDDTSLQLVALGARSDLLVLEALANEFGGDLLRADVRDDLTGLVRSMRSRAGVPIYRNVSLELPQGMVHVHPRRLGALRPGDDLVLTGKLAHPIDGDVVLRARGADGVAVEERFPIHLAAARSEGAERSRHAHLPRTWAAEEIEFLTATAGEESKRDIIALSTEFNVLSRYTALIALENDAMYREFNVVRTAGRKDRWGGELEKTEKKPNAVSSSDAPAGGATATPTPDAVAPPPPVEEAEAEETSFDRKDSGAGRARAEDPAPSFEPSPEPAGSPSVPRDISEEADANYDKLDLAGDDEDAEGGDGERFSRPPPATSKAPSAPKKKSSAADGILNPNSGSGAGMGKSGGWGGPIRHKWRPQLQFSKAAAPSSRTLARLADLVRERDRSPESRRAHFLLTRAATRAGVPEALDHARAWAQVDPDHAPALIAFADQLAARSDPMALRTYGSAVEVRPFDRQLQARVATAFERKGDLRRACAHRRAVVSIAPQTAGNHEDLARCLLALGRRDDAVTAAHEGIADAKKGASLRSLEQAIAAGTPLKERREPLHSFPELKLRLRWSGEADLDLAIVDSRGRRRSSIHQRSVLVREEDNEEQLTVNNVSEQLFIEVTRHDQGSEPVSGRLTITTPSGSRTVDVSLTSGTRRLGSVRWSRR